METKGEITRSTHRTTPPQGGRIARAKRKEQHRKRSNRVSFGRSSEKGKKKRHEEKNETLGDATRLASTST
jgi:hypothetical protein